jgi:hypothetical protein
MRRQFSPFLAEDGLALDWVVCDGAKVAERARLLVMAGSALAPATIRWEAWYLVRQCRLHAVPPPAELDALLSALLGADAYRNKGPRDPPAWRAAIAFEAGHPPDPTHKAPSLASETAITAHVWPGEAADQHRELRNWRQDPRYRCKVEWRRYRG